MLESTDCNVSIAMGSGEGVVECFGMLAIVGAGKPLSRKDGYP